MKCTLAKTKLNKIKVLIDSALNDFYISHDKFTLINDVLKEYVILKNM